jgi:hypothetical protein
VRMHDVKFPGRQESSKEPCASGTRKARRDRVHAEPFGERPALKRPAGQGDEFGLVAAGAQAAQQEQNLALPTAPVGSSVEMQRNHSAAECSIPRRPANSAGTESKKRSWRAIAIAKELTN